MQTFNNVFAHSASRTDIIHEEMDSFATIPSELVTKAHAVCIHEGKIVLVHHPRWKIWGLPGGTREVGEAIKISLAREIQEEANCEVFSLRPLCSHKLITAEGAVEYRLNYLCEVKPLGNFEGDPAGNITKIVWINPADYRQYIEPKPFKHAVMESALRVLGINSN